MAGEAQAEAGAGAVAGVQYGVGAGAGGKRRHRRVKAWVKSRSSCVDGQRRPQRWRQRQGAAGAKARGRAAAVAKPVLKRQETATRSIRIARTQGMDAAKTPAQGSMVHGEPGAGATPRRRSTSARRWLCAGGTVRTTVPPGKGAFASAAGAGSGLLLVRLLLLLLLLGVGRYSCSL